MKGKDNANHIISLRAFAADSEKVDERICAFSHLVA